MAILKHVEIGQKFGKLSIISELDRLILPSGQRPRRMLCKCDCGQDKEVLLQHLSSGKIRSCGCLQGEHHGKSETKLYGVWRQMIERCHKEYTKDANKKNYQQRGIIVCQEWRESFKCFFDWAINNGYQEGLEIDRRENDKGYFPWNCRFVAGVINTNNRRITVMIEINGEQISARLYLRQRGIYNDDLLTNNIISRIRRGWEIERAISEPVSENLGRPKSIAAGHSKSRLGKSNKNPLT